MINNELKLVITLLSNVAMSRAVDADHVIHALDIAFNIAKSSIQLFSV